jgi:hypothetical protein
MVKEMIAKYPGTCYGCCGPIEEGQRIVWFGRGEAYHRECEPQNSIRRNEDEGFEYLFEHEGQLDV